MKELFDLLCLVIILITLHEINKKYLINDIVIGDSHAKDLSYDNEIYTDEDGKPLNNPHNTIGDTYTSTEGNFCKDYQWDGNQWLFSRRYLY